MLQFIRTLRKLHSPLFDKTFHLLQLEEHPDWDNDWDTGDFTILAHWFFHNDTYKDSFDWDTNLQYEEYRVFRTRYERYCWTITSILYFRYSLIPHSTFPH